MRKATPLQRFRYLFDNTMSRGTIALIGWLAVISLLMIIAISLLVLLSGAAPVAEDGQSAGLGDLIWMGFARAMDSAAVWGDTGNWLFVTAMLGITLGGIFIVSSLIGVLTSGIDSRISELRKGRSFVVESGHTLILGWSDQVFNILSQLAIANASKRRACVVILAEKDKVEMEDEIREKVDSLGKMRVVCRTGSPIDLTDLEIVNPHEARSIIIVPREEAESDAQVIKTVLAITNNPRRRPEPYYIIAELTDAKNMEAARLVGGSETEFLDANNTIAKLIVQTTRQVGLSGVYMELLGFEGDEIYFQEEPALVGKTFGDALLSYEKSTVIGLQFSDGSVKLCPDMDTVISAGDKVVAISEDDNTVVLSSTTPNIDASAIADVVPKEAEPEHTLILGWNRRATTIINELDSYVAPGSTVAVVAATEDGAEQIKRLCSDCKNLEITYRQGDTTDRRTLDSLNPHEFQHIVVLCYSDTLDAQRADARTLITLLHLRDIERRMGERFSIVSEMLDDRNRELAEVTEADDFIVSDKLISLMLAQISENKHLKDVFGGPVRPGGVGDICEAGGGLRVGGQAGQLLHGGGGGEAARALRDWVHFNEWERHA